MVVIKWTDQSLDDIQNIAAFISRDSRKYARIMVSRIMERTLILKISSLIPEFVPYAFQCLYMIVPDFFA